jgi:glycosyltransferase involved in cell wall biosynthesis
MLRTDRRARVIRVQHHIAFHGVTQEIKEVLRRESALLHVSLQKAFPNAVAKELACRLPVAVSSLPELPLVVEEASNALAWDPTRLQAIADTMERVMQILEEDYLAPGDQIQETCAGLGRSRRLSCKRRGPLPACSGIGKAEQPAFWSPVEARELDA